jgi:hypothetical protein
MELLALQVGQEQQTHPHPQGYLQSVLAVVVGVQDLQFLVAMEEQEDSPQVVVVVVAQLKLAQLLVLVALAVREWQS